VARKAIIIATVADTWADLWDVREERPTIHGWPLRLGWPHGVPRGRGGTGGPRIIVTPDLEALCRASPKNLPLGLPCGTNAIKRVRRLLGLNRYWECQYWWLSRLDDLDILSGHDFALKHKVSEGLVSLWHTRLIGERLRQRGWWLADDVIEMFHTRSTAAVADLLGCSAGTISKLRSAFRRLRNRMKANTYRAKHPKHYHRKQAPVAKRKRVKQ